MIDDDDEDDEIDSLLREAARIPALALEPDLVGRQLGRFRVDAKLGEGGMGIVYEAEDVELGRRVALKVLPRDAVADDERRRRFLREARTAAAVSHPNLAAIYDAGEADGTVFLAMELVRGTTLRARISGAPDGMPVADALAIALQIARGLGKAHAAGVVHRDLKPENVMIGADGNAKVVDFGLAKLAGPNEGEPRAGELSTQDGRILGTPSYMAPEQAKGSRAGATADVFSLGVVLFEMLTGSRPFGGSALVDVLVAVARDAAPPPSKRAPRVPRELDRIVLRCLEKDPALRFEDGDAVAEALAGVDLAATPSRSRWVLAGALLVAGGTISFFVHSARDSAPVAPPSVAAAPSASGIGSGAAPIVAVAATEPLIAASALPSAGRAALPPPRASTSAPAAAAKLPREATSAAIDPLARQK